ncbi:MAG: isopenicillin N synthase family oxygenase [Phenylobacterium sp.]|uniref:isopenicillin N synthase family dioxygenase n=1 Tax=Phenylobacterium sp. TaxID=1871053 RepID=UPI001B6658D6|nr:2OG-Fe(II) oxygenase family protein [Phenylobacterium sp.]MBP7648708.1 isopenicillin N synthase family oxygenase [Phenylobacterium sp.]MBP7817061.1 isopenicillin N synthase family oxygenase [Phenylobacterium sp.]MBP9230988.1 isopenicillin N synthase family oxygenase [Phenylobacterium sp.]MBP9753537.1 isopenicillin N synthase family oxygenase [Phenylobacterium sp.]
MTRRFQTVPVVNIAGLTLSDPAARQAVADGLGRAAREAGFLYVTGHGLDPALISELLSAAQRYFAQPMSAKLASYIGRSSNHSGYVPEGEEVFPGGKIDRKEAYDIGLDWPACDARAPMMGPNLWPQDEGFRRAAGAYYSAISGLARRLFGGFALALGLPQEAFEPHLTCPPSQLRVIHYPFDPHAEPDQQGIGAHTDYEFFTLLHGTAPGLEVMNGEGLWIDCPPIPGAFVVNIGDMLEAWTNGEFVATTHRVRRVGEERYSFPFFATCDYWTVVEPHPAFVSADRPARYPRLVSGDHLMAQTIATFAYLKERRVGAPATPAFGQEAKV